MEETPAITPPRKKSTLRRLARICGVSAGLIAGLVFITPFVLSAEFFRKKIEEAASDALGVPVQLEDYSLSWFSGFTMDGLSVPNPDGFPQHEPLLELRSMRGDLSLLQLVRGRVDLSGTVEGLEIRVHQKADGTTNLESLADFQIDVDQRDRRDMIGSRSDWSGLDALRLDLNLRDALVEISHEEQGVLESLRKLNGTISKEFGDADLRLAMDAEIHRTDVQNEPGRVQLTVDVDTTGQRPMEIDLDTNGLDLQRYRPLIAMVMPPGQITTLEGVVSGTLRGHYDYESKVSLNGSLTVEHPVFAGAASAGVELRAPRWVINPHLEIELSEDRGSPPRLAAEGTFLDLDFMNVAGMPSEDLRGGLGLTFNVDLDALRALSDFLPAGLETEEGSLQGLLLVTPQAGSERLFDLVSVSARGSLDLPRLRSDALSLSGFRADFSLAQGIVQLETQEGRLNSGTIGLRARADLLGRREVPLSVDLLWEDGKVGSQAVTVLRYFVPLFAGLADVAQLDFESRIDAELHISGPAMPREDEPVLAWLDRWQGSGELHLTGGSFAPAPDLQALLAVTGNEGKLEVDELETTFTIASGYVTTALMELESKGRRYGIAGRTSLAGEIDYSIDLTKMLEGHGTGDRIREALGNQPLRAHLRGHLDRPELGMPDISQSLQSVLENAARSALEKGLKDLLKKIR